MRLNRQIAVRAGLCAVIVYLAAHAVTGRQGLVSYVALQERERTLLQEEAALDMRIESLRTRADRLRPTNLDLDYLEERARSLLNATRSDEFVLLLPAEFADQP